MTRHRGKPDRSTAGEAAPAPGRWRMSLQRALVLVVTALASIYGVVLVAGALFYRRLLYPAPNEFPNQVPATARLLEVPTADGAHLRVLLYDAPPGAPIVVHFHGNGETMGHNFWIADELRQRGLGVALVEYRGYGLSRGEPSPTEIGLYADATAALDALESAGYGRKRVVLWGQSLGSGVAAEMAMRGRAGAVVLVSPYTSIVDMARLIVPPVLPVGLIVRDRYDTLAKAGRIAIPALVIHGDADEVIPHEMGERGAKALPYAALYTVHGGHHGDLVAVDAAGVFKAVAKLARDLVAHPPGEMVVGAPTTAAASTPSSTPAPAAREGIDAAVGTDGSVEVVTAPLAGDVLGSILGCWQLDDGERWTIARTAVGGARVTRTISTRGGAGMDLDYARRAAIPSDLRYDRGQGQLAFTTAGPIHGLLFVFKVGPNGLEGSWFSSRVPGTDDYRWTGNNATVRRRRTRSAVAIVTAALTSCAFLASRSMRWSHGERDREVREGSDDEDRGMPGVIGRCAEDVGGERVCREKWSGSGRRSPATSRSTPTP